MNVAWIGVVSLFVLAEKLAPGGERISFAAGLVLLAWGGALLVPALHAV